MIAILNFGIGNILSIKNMLRKVGRESILAVKAADVKEADKIILPGVGSFDSGMKMLKKADFFTTFYEIASEGKIPILGICLGAQILMDGSEEGTESGLGLIRGISRKFDFLQNHIKLPVPHMGWADVSYLRKTGLNRELTGMPRYYFVHSYHMCCENKEDELAFAEYGYSFTAAINKGNIFGVQFHPEKSHKFGMEILKNFADL